MLRPVLFYVCPPEYLNITRMNADKTAELSIALPKTISGTCSHVIAAPRRRNNKARSPVKVGPCLINSVRFIMRNLLL